MADACQTELVLVFMNLTRVFEEFLYVLCDFEDFLVSKLCISLLKVILMAEFLRYSFSYISIINFTHRKTCFSYFFIDK